MSRIHDLKTHSGSFIAVWRGQKTAEFRKDDRGFEVGDTLHLLDYNPDRGAYSGLSIDAEITDIRRGPAYGIPDGYAMLSLGQIRKNTSSIATGKLDAESNELVCIASKAAMRLPPEMAHDFAARIVYCIWYLQEPPAKKLIECSVPVERERFAEELRAIKTQADAAYAEWIAWVPTLPPEAK